MNTVKLQFESNTLSSGDTPLLIKSKIKGNVTSIKQDTVQYCCEGRACRLSRPTARYNNLIKLGWQQ